VTGSVPCGGIALRAAARVVLLGMPLSQARSGHLTDPYTNKPFVKLYAYSRVGGGVANSQAVKLLKLS
jgi:hypothetical protein